MQLRAVAPFTGAWIEIGRHIATGNINLVAPFTGAWIEIIGQITYAPNPTSRSLHGSVD